MKVAIVLTGHMRRWREVLPNFKERVVAKYNPDIFISTWNDEGWYGQNQNDHQLHNVNRLKRKSAERKPTLRAFENAAQNEKSGKKEKPGGGGTKRFFVLFSLWKE